MRKIKVSSSTSDKFRLSIIRFIVKYGDGHITKKAINWLKRTPFSALKTEQGDLINVFINNNKILGVLVIADYGLEQAVIAVHSDARKYGLANRLVTEALENIDRFYVKVANDNIPSLRLCFSVGMRAFDMVKGPTGKPTLVLGMGNWDADEWHTHKKVTS